MREKELKKIEILAKVFVILPLEMKMLFFNDNMVIMNMNRMVSECQTLVVLN